MVFLALQQVDQIDRGVEAHALAMAGDARHGQRGSQVGLSVPGGAEVEAGQIAIHGQLGHVHLVAHRTHGAIRMFLLQQVFEPQSPQRRTL
ncbi:hypothetical protein D3C84_1105060 [compost metagenome]